MSSSIISTSSSRKPNILFTSVGRRVELLNQFSQGCGREHIFGVDALADAPGLRVVRNPKVAPGAAEPDYVPFLLDFCRQNEIDMLIPLIDPELEIISQHVAQFEELGCLVISSGLDTIEICNDKVKTAEFCLYNSIPHPAVIYKPVHESDFPLFVKPRFGSRSVGATKVKSQRELDVILASGGAWLIQEFVDGQEYTIDVLVNQRRQVGFCVPRKRIDVRDGEVIKASTVRDEAIIELCIKVASVLPDPFGVLCMQCFKKPSGEVVLTEINPRFGGGSPLSIHAGADFPGNLIAWLNDSSQPVFTNRWKEGRRMSRYFGATYWDESGAGATND